MPTPTGMMLELKETSVTQTSPVTLEQALGAAQAEMQAVYKDATNQHHRYKYASAENMIAQCRLALHNAGLVLYVAAQVIEERGSLILARITARILHPSTKDALELMTEVPVYVDKGRPIDKAYLGALTGGLSYLLRGLLLVVRDDESIDARNDTAYVPQGKGDLARVADPKDLRAGDVVGGRYVFKEQLGKPGNDQTFERPVQEVQNLRGETGKVGWSFEEAKKALEVCTKREDLLEVADRISKEISDPKVQMQLADVFFQCEGAVK